MRFMNVGCGCGGYPQFQIINIQQCGQITTVRTGQGDDVQLAIMSGSQGLYQIARGPIGAEHDQHIAGVTQSADLLGENIVVTEVAADGGKGSAVGGQVYGGKARALLLQAVKQTAHKNLAYSGGNTGADHEDLVFIEQTAHQAFTGFGNKRYQG